MVVHINMGLIVAIIKDHASFIIIIITTMLSITEI